MRCLVFLFTIILSIPAFAEDMAKLEAEAMRTQPLPCPTVTAVLPISELGEMEGSSACLMGSRIVPPLMRWPYTQLLRPAYQHDVRERFVNYLCEQNPNELKSQVECLTSLVVDSPQMMQTLVSQLQSDYQLLQNAKLLGPDQRNRIAYLSAVLREKLPLKAQGTK